jgi:hypothetical protein
MNKNVQNLGLTILILVVLGCSCPRQLEKLARKGNATPTPTVYPTSSPTARDTPGAPTKNGGYDITMAKYNQISVGTSRSDVERILGGKGTEISKTEGGGVHFSVDKWEGEGFKSIILSFKEDKVMTRSQIGLK